MGKGREGGTGKGRRRKGTGKGKETSGVVTEGHLRTKYNVKSLFLNPLIYQCTMTHFGIYLFLVGTHRGNLLVSSRFSTGDLNFCVRSIRLWEPCVEKWAMLRASMHRPVGGAL